MKDVCPNCHAGALRLHLLTYAAWHAAKDSGREQFVIAPYIPAWFCGVCGVKYFDIQTMGWLAPLLGPTADPDGSVQWSQLRSERDMSSIDGDFDMRRLQ